MEEQVIVLNEKECEIVIALAESDMSALKASKRFYMHRNTFYYHIERICKKTGLNPRNFFDLIELYCIAQKQQESCESDICQ